MRAKNQNNKPCTASQIFTLKMIAEGLDKFPKEIPVGEGGLGAFGKIETYIGTESFGKVGG